MNTNRRSFLGFLFAGFAIKPLAAARTPAKLTSKPITDSTGAVVGYVTYGAQPARIGVTGIVWGADESVNVYQITNLPADTRRVRIRLRNNNFAAVFVRTSTGVREFMLRKAGPGDYRLDCEQGCNVA